MYIQNRSIPMVIILSIVTCGIYFYIWIYQVSLEINNTLGHSQESAGLEVLFSILTCGIYTISWFYKYAKKLVTLSENMGAPVTDNSLVCLLLPIFGLQVVSQGIMQSQINMLADGMQPRV